MPPLVSAHIRDVIHSGQGDPQPLGGLECGADVPVVYRQTGWRIRDSSENGCKAVVYQTPVIALVMIAVLPSTAQTV